MSLRLNGSVLGKRNVPTATVATGVWNLRAQALSRRDNIWPIRDPDAVAFAATSGATDVDAINAFVRGIKALGLYDKMVCWPLRSSQNAGTGTTAYSLGGLGTYNGTLNNGPTWGASGVAFDGSNDHMAIASLPSLGASNWAFIIRATLTSLNSFTGFFFQGDTVSDRAFSIEIGTTNTNLVPAIRNAADTQWNVANSGIKLTAGAPQIIAAGYNGKVFCSVDNQAFVESGAFTPRVASSAGTLVGARRLSGAIQSYQHMTASHAVLLDNVTLTPQTLLSLSQIML